MDSSEQTQDGSARCLPVIAHNSYFARRIALLCWNKNKETKIANDDQSENEDKAIESEEIENNQSRNEETERETEEEVTSSTYPLKV